MNSKMYNPETILSELIKFALLEDLSDIGDITTNALVDPSETASVKVSSRGEGIVSGIKTLRAVVKEVDHSLTLDVSTDDGQAVKANEVIAIVEGSLASILTLERTALNFLSHLSGIATQTKRFVDVVKQADSPTIIRDTRKTLPGYRALEKEAVIHGGGHNHRRGLYDAFLVKDNHIASRDLDTIAKRCRDFNPEAQLEIEVDSLEQLNTILKYDPDLILLDNFSVSKVRDAINICPSIDLEVSGGVTIDSLYDYAKTGVKYIAVGSITHSPPILDIGFDMK